MGLGNALVREPPQIMKIDYTPYLGESEDGRIWWRLEDAIKLGAGPMLSG
jgi:hypothetical protein